MTRHYLYPLWLRLWHWINAALFLVLIISGVSLHYSSTQSLLMPFKTAIAAHNVAGLLLAALYLAFVVMNLVSGNWRQYVPRIRGFVSRALKQTRYYLSGIFKGEPHPYEASRERKFNPLQQITYVAIMYLFMPLIVVSGLLLMFPEFAPDEVLGLGGVWPMATAHTAAGFFLSVFMLGHIYLGTTGHTVSANFASMLTGWHEEPAHVRSGHEHASHKHSVPKHRKHKHPVQNRPTHAPPVPIPDEHPTSENNEHTS